MKRLAVISVAASVLALAACSREAPAELPPVQASAAPTVIATPTPTPTAPAGPVAGSQAHFARAMAGRDVILIEAEEPGWGASGRNGGQVIPGLKYDPDEMIDIYGEDKGRALLQFAATTAA